MIVLIKVRFETPDPNLARWEKGCGKIICTGFINVLINDRDGSLLGSVSQAVPNNPYTGVISGCASKSDWNGI